MSTQNDKNLFIPFSVVKVGWTGRLSGGETACTDGAVASVDGCSVEVEMLDNTKKDNVLCLSSDRIIGEKGLTTLNGVRGNCRGLQQSFLRWYVVHRFSCT